MHFVISVVVYRYLIIIVICECISSLIVFSEIIAFKYIQTVHPNSAYTNFFPTTISFYITFD